MAAGKARQVVIGNRSVHPRKFLKSLGFNYNKNGQELDYEFLESLDERQRDRVEAIWALASSQQSSVKAIYSVPRKTRQAALLCSHDRDRTAASLAWFREIVARRIPSSIIELGCGAGFLLRYLRQEFPQLEIAGIDQHENLLKTLPDDMRISTFVGDYRTVSSESRYSGVICDFGWDNIDIPNSGRPHSISEVGGLKYCPSCSEDAVPFFKSLLAASARWTAEDAWIAATGRLTNIGYVRSFYFAAEDIGWTAKQGDFIVRRVETPQGLELFPSFVLTRERENALSFEEVASIYARSLAA